MYIVYCQFYFVQIFSPFCCRLAVSFSLLRRYLQLYMANFKTKNYILFHILSFNYKSILFYTIYIYYYRMLSVLFCIDSFCSHFIFGNKFSTEINVIRFSYSNSIELKAATKITLTAHNHMNATVFCTLY